MVDQNFEKLYDETGHVSVFSGRWMQIWYQIVKITNGKSDIADQNV